MTPQQEQLLNELAELIWEKGDPNDMKDLKFLEMCIHNQTLTKEQNERVIRIEERLRGYGIER